MGFKKSKMKDLNREDINRSLIDFVKRKQEREIALEESRNQQRAAIKDGDILKGIDEYKIEKVIGIGGMGIVYITYDTTLDERVALKTFYESDAWDKDTRDGLKTEANTWIELGFHKNIVKALRIEEIHGKIYIVMEYIGGGDLSKRIEEGLKPKEVLDFAIQICNGMDYAYQKMKMVHRDLKPGNILISDEEETFAKVSDFGTATSIMSTGGGLTLPYASPEQWMEWLGHNMKIDTRSDIYSFGMILYEMLIGKIPFIANNVNDLFMMHLKAHPQEPKVVNPYIHEKLNAIVMKCLEKEPSRRYQSFSVLKHELIDFYTEYFDETYYLYENTSLSMVGEGAYMNWSNKGVAQMELGNYETAIQCYDKALEMNSWDKVTWLNKSTALLRMGQYENALECSDKALGIDPSYQKALSNKGTILGILGRYNESLQWFGKALRISRLPEILIGMGDVYSNLRNYTKAINHYDQALQIDKESEAAWIGKGIVLEKLRRYQEAVACYDWVLHLNPQNYFAWGRKGLLFFEAGRYEEALNFYNNVIRIQPDNGEALGNMGNIMRTVGHYDDALQFYDRALQALSEPSEPTLIDPDVNPEDVWYNKGLLLYVNYKNYEKALECFDNALAVNPQFDDAWTEKGTLFAIIGQLERSIQCYNEALKINPRSASAYKNMGISYMKMGRLQEALDYMNRAFEIEPNNQSIIDARQYIIQQINAGRR
jgi:tetratricopeptide (TPR) repeat protein